MAVSKDVKRLVSGWEKTEHRDFEELWTKCFDEQFNRKFKPNATCFVEKAQINQYILDGTSPANSPKLIEFDGFVGLVGDHAPQNSKGDRTPTIINFEYSVSKSNGVEYWSGKSDGKIARLMQFMDTNNHTTRKDRYSRLQEKKQDIPGADDFSLAYMIGIDRNRSVKLADELFAVKANLEAEFPGRNVKVSAIEDSNALLIEMDDFQIVAGLLDLGQCADHMTSVYEISKHLFQKDGMRKRYFDRLLFELTFKLAGPKWALSIEDPIFDIPVEMLTSTRPSSGLYVGDDIRIQDKRVNVHSFKMRIHDLIRMCRVERTVNRVGALQRIPDSGHMRTIARDGIDKRKLFLNPIVVSTTSKYKFKSHESGGVSIESIEDGGVIAPYAWDLIDGQHRVFSGYYSDLDSRKLSDAEFNVVLYTFDDTINTSARQDINAEVFFDLNYRSKTPDKEIALVRSVNLAEWPEGWIEMQTGRAVFSSIVLASKS